MHFVEELNEGAVGDYAGVESHLKRFGVLLEGVSKQHKYITHDEMQKAATPEEQQDEGL